MAAQHTEVLIVTLDPTPDISKQPTFHDYSFDSRKENNKSHSDLVQYVLTLKTYQHIN